MKLYAPSYYEKFKCIADRCTHSCCVGWEIAVDEDSLHRFGEMGADGEQIRSHIRSDKDGAVIELSETDRCPFLDEAGLCRIISKHGEGCIPRICREHPRFYTRICDRVEMGIGAVCEEACRLMLECDGFELVPIGECSEAAAETDYDTLPARDRIISVLWDKERSFEAAISAVCEEFSVPEAEIYPSAFADATAELELLSEDDRVCLVCDGRMPEADEYLRRFLTYLIYRHVSAAENYDALRARIGFSLLLCRMLEGELSRRGDASSVTEVARMISEEIEYSESNTDALIFELECRI